ncbi:hypothetical protein BKA61DRAFT_727923 [Leptodontidium sp. MPI-SDFR-AT-0119]|nr:hypothetical protein BKA61DRAFT_727923 [Leptodontidium sp. MPI-SDFR-AT-0119]
MGSLKSPVPQVQDLEPCKFPQLNKAFVAPDERLLARVDISSESRIALHNFCKNQDVELEAVIQAAWALTLHSYLGSDTTLFGYGNLTICGDRFDAAHTILQHLKRIAQSDYATSSVSWHSVKGSDVGADLFNTELFITSDRQSSDDTERENASKMSDLVFLYTSQEEISSIQIEHNLSFFDAAQGQRVARTIRNILAKIVSGPSTIIENLNLIDGNDLEQIWAWNHVIPEEPRLCAHDLLQKQAQSTPEALAIKSWDGNLTYAEFDTLSTVLGRHLSTKGVVPNMVIPICFEKCKWTIVAMIAVLKAGAAFTTLDPVQPTNRLVDTILETESKIILAGDSQSERFKGNGWDVISNVPELAQLSLAPEYTAAAMSVKSTDLCYVAFTSGSTGRPKGVAHQHLASCTSITMKARDGSDSGYGPGKSIMQFASQAFAASVVEIFKTLGNGGCICIPSEKVRLNNITEFMKEHEITRVFFPPTLLKLFKPEMFPTLEILLTGGEPVLPDLIATWAPKLKFVEAVGMTEGVAITTNIKTDGTMNRMAQTMSGVPWIVDPDDYNKLAPIGALGELMVEGPCLAQGYLHDEEKTNAAFIEAPLWARKGAYPNRKFRLYRTGDMARYYSDGLVRLLGRRDTRVKLNGQRIELGDVETHMQNNLPESMAVAADVVTTSQNRSFLVGYVFSSTDLGKPNNPADGLLPKDGCRDILNLLPTLREKMSVALPTYMVPTIFLPFSRRPTNMSGKMDRKRLRQIASAMSIEDLVAYSASGSQRTLPSTDTQKIVAGLWANLFGIDVESIALEDNFMVLGGDSLQAIKLVRMARELGHVLSTGEILQNPSLEGMSSVVKQPRGQELSENRTPSFVISVEDTTRIEKLVGPYTIETISMATDWQSWAVYTGLLKMRGWTDYLIFDFKGNLDVARLEAACKALLVAFPILRTVFVADKRQVLQVVLKDYPFDFQNHECMTGEDASTTSQRLFEQDTNSKASLGEPIVRFALVRDSGTYRLLLRISHAQYDVISLPSLLGALKDSYSGVEIRQSTSFSDFVSFVVNDESDAETFWRELLQGSKMTKILPRDKPSYSNIVDTTLKRTVGLPALQGQGITTASFVLSAWAMVLSQLSSNSDVVFGRLSSGRHAAMTGIEDIVGPCMNITPIRAHVDASMTVGNFVKQLQSQHLASLSFENIGFRHIIEKCTDWVPWTRFSSIVNHVHIDETMKHAFTLSQDLKYDFDVYEPMHDKSDMWLQTKPVGTQMEVELRFSRAVVSNDCAEEALKLFCDIIQLPSEAIQKPIKSFLVASPDALPKNLRNVVEKAWNQVLMGQETPHNTTIGLDTPFYDVWGDLIAAAALCKSYRTAGFDVDVEDIVDNPTMRKQIVLLGRTAVALSV